MHHDFSNNALWRKLRAHVLLRVDQHVRALKRPGTQPGKTEELRGRIDELERLIRAENGPFDDLETQPTAQGGTE